MIPQEFLQLLFTFTIIELLAILYNHFGVARDDALVAQLSVQEGDRTVALQLDGFGEHGLGLCSRAAFRQHVWGWQRRRCQRRHKLLGFCQESLQLLSTCQLVIMT